eukprot:gene9042-biopygen16697
MGGRTAGAAQREGEMPHRSNMTGIGDFLLCLHHVRPGVFAQGTLWTAHRAAYGGAAYPRCLSFSPGQPPPMGGLPAAQPPPAAAAPPAPPVIFFSCGAIRQLSVPFLPWHVPAAVAPRWPPAAGRPAGQKREDERPAPQAPATIKWGAVPQ